MQSNLNHHYWGPNRHYRPEHHLAKLLVDTEMPVPGSILRPTASKTTFALETRRDVDLDDER